ncbi:hypothetical protein AGDE_13111 [Angomonas deanei]|uniref:Uncharacterized protein n=1 Tax=Angomonas deanei TaxID=59799 RepID=A0A7G2CF47_9TRYP|nr:hypothetical protein AGDE_13111 [Angomonas deanei]CAD2218528.1 hypothetical protein, conserved [Angomonas deanei]|eukprot:EPY22719.1 hypothetical protein AGDE_13111 [Angomonas deanei]
MLRPSKRRPPPSIPLPCAIFVGKFSKMHMVSPYTREGCIKKTYEEMIVSSAPRSLEIKTSSQRTWRMCTVMWMPSCRSNHRPSCALPTLCSRWRRMLRRFGPPPTCGSCYGC